MSIEDWARGLGFGQNSRNFRPVKERRLRGATCGDLPQRAGQDAGMEPERPPEIEAEYRVVRGPWPRWALQLGLVKLALRAGGVVVGLMLAALLVAWLAFGR
jgi:hypothetical protein